jgi:hypothetical protein
MRKGISKFGNLLLLASNTPLLAYLLTLVVWLLTLASRLLYNGLVYGFDYGLFHPDGSLYAFRALLFAGYSELDAGQAVATWYDEHSFKAKYEGPELYFENNPFLWDQYITRLLYPLLSTPFVLLFGVPGMLVVPSLTLLITMLITTRISINLGAPVVGWILAVLITSSTSVTRWMFANITDGLLLLFVSIFVLMISKNNSLDLSRRQIVVMFALIGLSALTRFSAFFWLGVAILFLIRKKWLLSILIAVVTCLSHIPIFLRPFTGHVLPGYNDRNLIEKLLIYPLNLGRVTVYEIGQLFVLDRVLLILLMATFVIAFMNKRELPAQLFLISAVTLWLTGSVNGVLGVNYRYQLPLTPILLYLLADRVSRRISVSLNAPRGTEKA